VDHAALAQTAHAVLVAEHDRALDDQPECVRDDGCGISIDDVDGVLD
jgi:hypothetical protein